MEGGQQRFPELVEQSGHVTDTAGHRDDRVLFGQDDAELPEGTITPVGSVATSPELVAIALLPVVARIAAIGDLFGRGGPDPVFGEQSPSVPQSALQVELPELGDVFGADPQPIPAE